MVQKLEIDGVHMDVGKDIKRYVHKKIGRLDKYIPRAVRGSAHLEVKLKEGKAKTKQTRTCEVILHLPHDTITISETTINMFAAVDIVEEKLKNQLHRYKQLHANPALHRRLLAKLKRQPA
ncbi:MAG TPA: ribosome-associated translation inhibitor RaiA [Candidatus Saccharimonadales bacterium]|nr:ribosome-associated translation inhibitor RaiA [Candidatus Saccharimonadales bacterium]